jgi:hypothetical protein
VKCTVEVEEAMLVNMTVLKTVEKRGIVVVVVSTLVEGREEVLVLVMVE